MKPVHRCLENIGTYLRKLRINISYKAGDDSKTDVSCTFSGLTIWYGMLFTGEDHF